jgi:hypothetical protein
MSDGARLVAGAGLSGAGGTEPLQAAAATSTTSTPSTVPANATLGMFSVSRTAGGARGVVPPWLTERGVPGGSSPRG